MCSFLQGHHDSMIILIYRFPESARFSSSYLTLHALCTILLCLCALQPDILGRVPFTLQLFGVRGSIQGDSFGVD